MILIYFPCFLFSGVSCFQFAPAGFERTQKNDPPLSWKLVRFHRNSQDHPNWAPTIKRNFLRRERRQIRSPQHPSKRERRLWSRFKKKFNVWFSGVTFCFKIDILTFLFGKFLTSNLSKKKQKTVFCLDHPRRPVASCATLEEFLEKKMIELQLAFATSLHSKRCLEQSSLWWTPRCTLVRGSAIDV